MLNLVWPIRNLVTAICSLLDFLKAGLHSPHMGLIRNSLLWIFLSQCCCSFLWRKLLILGFKSVYGLFYLSEVKSEADLAAASALSFPLSPMWLGIQQKKISLFDIVGFYGIATIVLYLMLNTIYTYILNISDLVWLGFMAYQPL